VVAAALITAGGTIAAAIVDHDDITPTAEAPSATTQTTAARPTTTRPDDTKPCKELVSALRDESRAVDALKDHLCVEGGHVVGRDAGFQAAYALARDGQAVLPGAYDNYAATGRPLPPDKETVPRGQPVQELGDSLDDLTSSSAKDVEDAYNALPDWAAKLGNTADIVSEACR
jgi:hypothetical protein